MNQIESSKLGIFAILFTFFSPFASFKVISSRTRGKWRYVIYPAFWTTEAFILYNDPALGLLAGVVLAGAFVSGQETLKLVGLTSTPKNPPAGQSGTQVELKPDRNNRPGSELDLAAQKSAMLSYIRDQSPSLSDFILLTDSLYGFDAVYDVLTSPNVRSVDGRLIWIEDEPTYD